MSALAGYWTFADSEASPREQCRLMLSAQEAYGAGEPTIWSEAGLALGQAPERRLTERKSGTGPLSGGGGRYILAADLRLDNRDELGRRLGLHPEEARGLSDAAMLLRGFERYGDTILDHILGDFAFILWDAHRRHILLARDLLGQRPLYYHHSSRFFAFASRPMGLHALAQIARAPDVDRMVEFVGLLPHFGEKSFYSDIARVEPGQIVTISAGRKSARHYWSPSRQELRLASFDDYQEAFRAEVDRAVRARLGGGGRALATHLSGGWDSSTVTATAARLLQGSGRVVAYTSAPRLGDRSGAPGKRIADEAELASATAALYDNVDHIVLRGSGASPIARLDDYVALFDRPVYNLCNFVWLTAIRQDAQARGVKILLTGENGNWTISAGPHTLLADLIRQRRWSAWWREAVALARTRNARLRGIAANSFGPWIPNIVWDRVRRLTWRPETASYTALHPSLEGQVRAQRERLNVGLARRPNDNFAETVGAFRHYDFGDNRAGALAGWGVDERDPTADRRLIEFCLSLPLDMLLKNGVRRPLARAALTDRLPAAVLAEKRKGYQAADWHEGMTANRQAIRDLVEEIGGNDLASSIIDVGALRTWVADWPQGGWEQPQVMARYRGALLGALSAGHFILSTSR